MSYIMIYITASSTFEAKELASQLVEERLIACANITKDVESVFRFQGHVNWDNEAVVIAKSREDLFPEIQALVDEKHSYETPCVVAMPIIAGSDKYLAWLKAETKE